MNKKLRLAIISVFWSRLGGGEVGADLLRKNLKQKGLNVKILTTQKVSDDKDFIPINFRFPIPKEIILLGNFFLDKLIKRSIEKSFKTYSYIPDVIHVQNIYALPGSVEVARKLKIPITVTIREPLPKILLHPYNFLFKFIITQVLRSRNKILLDILKHKCDYVISVSDFIKNQLNNLGVPEYKITTIYNYPPKWKSGELYKKRPIQSNNDKIFLFYSGRLERAKGIHILIQSLREVLSHTKNFKLFIAGEGPFEKNLKSLCSKLNLNKYVTFLGKIPFNKMGKLYSSSDIVCIPSIWPEPLSRVAFEAMSLGKPVITTKVGGMAEAIEHGKNGFIVPPNNPKEFAKAIIELIDNQELRVNMGTEGRKTVQKKFDLEISVEEHIKLYKKMIKI